jgi:hypothetical protein
MAGVGPAPKPASKRRHHNPPAQWGGATPTTAPAAEGHDPELGFENLHPLVGRMWQALQVSAEARFYSAADWQRARMELWYANEVMQSGKPIPGNTWAAVQHGLTEMLVSPAAKRRAAIELKAAVPDSDEIAAVSMMSRYAAKIQQPSV